MNMVKTNAMSSSRIPAWWVYHVIAVRLTRGWALCKTNWLIPYVSYMSIFISFLVWPIDLITLGLQAYCFTWSNSDTLGTTPLDEGSARRRDFYWHHITFTGDRQPRPSRESNPQYQQANRRRRTPQTAWPLGSVQTYVHRSKFWSWITSELE